MSEPAPFHADVADAPEGARAYWLTAADGVRLRAVAWAGGRAAPRCIFPGRTEFAEKYGRVAGALAARGFSVAVIDWRGQGLSDRPAATRCSATSTISATTSATSRRSSTSSTGSACPGRGYLVAHSMGGCIGLRTLLERADFGAAIFSAPMWHLHMRAATRELTAR